MAADPEGGDRNARATRGLAAEYSARAGAYARYWAPVIHPLARRLLDALPLEHARRILDLGCGTGDLLGDLRAAAPAAFLVGADRAEGMVRVAQKTVPCSLFVTDAQALALCAESVDVAVLAFMLFHIPDPAAALCEVRRVLRANAPVGIVVWGTDPGTPGTRIWTEELDACGAAPEPRDPAVMGHDRMNTADKLTQLLREADFAPERIWAEPYAHEWPVDALFAMQATNGAPSRRLATLPEGTQALCCERVQPRLAALPAAERVQYMEVLYAVARRPD